MIKNALVVSVAILFFYMFGCKYNTNESGKMKGSERTEELSGQINKTVSRRVGMVIKIKEDQIEEYKRIHGDNYHGVRDLLNKYNMHNFSIFLHQLEDGNYYEFAYYEYMGNDFEEDMKQLAAEPRNIEWLKVCDAMQIPLEGYKSWAEMETIYYNP